MTERDTTCPDCGVNMRYHDCECSVDVLPNTHECPWCDGTGWRSSKPHAWFDDKPGVMTTWFPCDCGATPSE